MVTVITGGTLIDGRGGEPTQGASVVVNEQGRIEDVGRTDSFPKGAKVIDVAGKTIMPGLIDCHAHLFVDLKPFHELALTPPSLRVLQATENAKATLDGGVTSIRDTSGTPLGFKMAAEQGLIPAPRLRIAVAPLSQTGGHADLTLPSGIVYPLLPLADGVEWPNGICDGVSEVRKAARAVLRAGADFIKIMTSGGVLSPGDQPTYAQFTREETAAIVYEARAQGKTVASHAQATEGIRIAVESGVESIEHGIYLDESVVDLMKKRDTFLVPTLQFPKAAIRRGEESPGSVLPESMLKAREVIDDHRASIRMAIESGVKIAMGTDASVERHGNNAEELELLVETGMTPMQAIVAATKTAAECAHMDSDVGTLESGKFADLLVVDGNPLEDISLLQHKARLLMIMQGGVALKDAVTQAA